MSLSDIYSQLNEQQRQAVDTTEGPLLVVAGPGTGKTQLLSARAAKIVSLGTASASNILCLTYTEAGAAEMRSRMGHVMGVTGNDVAVHTFHSFGSWLIGQYPEQFSAQRALKPLDDLGRFRIFEQLLANLPLRHQLAVRGERDEFIRRHSVEEAIQAFKEAGLTPTELKQTNKTNQQTYDALQPLLDELFASNLNIKRLPEIMALATQFEPPGESTGLHALVLQSLRQAIVGSEESGKTAPLGRWRDTHTTIKNKQRVFKGTAQGRLLDDVIGLYSKYQAELQAQGKYDYADMILWAADALATNDDLRLDIAERFQYIMVDEYQDTNGAQNRLLDTILQANPVDSPNVMVVGDDDQAIMRFQGAEVSGMLQFAKTYQPAVIVLTDNYRSGQLILDAARQVILQTDERLEVSLPQLALIKQLVARNAPNETTIRHRQYLSPTAEYAAVASHIKALLAGGTPAPEIAVIGRKHAELARFVPFLRAQNITISYDRRENIIENNRINELLQLAGYVQALANQLGRAEHLLPTLLAASYWQLPVLATYQLAAQARQQKTSWLDTMLASGDSTLAAIAEWLVAAASYCKTHNFTQTLDVLIGREIVPATVLQRSPFMPTTGLSEEYLQLLSHLIRLRTAVLEARPAATGLGDLLEVASEYRASGLQLVDNNPILRGAADGVQVMSAHSAKGREFRHVIILSALDNVWGAKARSQNQRIYLPENLPLYPAGDADADRLRLFYVALTRAKAHILLTSYHVQDSGKAAPALGYLQLGEAGWWQPVEQPHDQTTTKATLETAWQPLIIPSGRPLQDVLQPLLANYRLSASALRNFLDICYAGPVAAIEQSVLQFPSAHNSHSALGSAVHKTLEILYQSQKTGTSVSREQLLRILDERLDASGLSSHELAAARNHGHTFLPQFVAQFTDLVAITATEQYLSADLPGSTVPLSGFIDALKVSDTGITVLDYKTGKPPLPEWQTKGLSEGKKISLHFYRQQLLFYKLLVDNSTLYKAKATHAKLIFVEPNETGDFIQLHIDDFSAKELAYTAQLITAVYNRMCAGDLPDTSKYSKDLKGILAFEADLIGQ